MNHKLIYGLFIELLVNILRVLLLKRVMDMFLSGDTDERLRKPGFCIYYFVTAALQSSFHMSVAYELFNFLGITVLSFLYRETWKKKVWVALICFSMDFSCSLAVLFAFAEEGIWQQPAIQVLLLLICVTAVERIFIPGGRAEACEIALDTRQTSLLVVIPSASILLLSAAWYGKIDRRAALVVCICTLVINLSVFYLYHLLRENYIILRESDAYRQQNSAYRNQLEVILESRSRIRSLRHDMRNHILALRALLQKNDVEEAERYLDSMQNFMTNPSEFAATGNDEVDSLLNYKLQRAEELLNQVETRIRIPEKLSLQSFDLNVVLGNLLDNAIDASMQTEEKKLRVAMRLDKGILFVNIRNSCRGMAEGRPKNLETTKADRENHGIGLKNVERIIEKYHGEMDLVCERGCMEADIMMYVKDL